MEVRPPATQFDRNTGTSTGGYRRKLNTSCWMCRKRKVRCDATADKPCTACNRAGIECRAHPNQLQPVRARRRRAAAQTSPVTVSSPLQAEINPPLNSNLSRFFEAGIISSNWTGFEENGTFRNVYIGTDVANLHHLVQDHDEHEHEHAGSNFLCYPFPAIRDELPWKPHPDMIGRHHYLTAESINDLSSFPVRPVRDALVETYFRDIHPGFPVIDEADFRRRYADPKDPPPLLTFQAILLAAARITDHPQVAASRAMTTATLYRRAKTLFDLRHESDRVDLIQAALHLAWYTENPDTVASNAYYWIGNATRIAFGMALHRTPSLRYVPPQRIRYYRKYKKIWWMLLYSEVMLALEYGRPCMIRAEDFDVGPLEEDEDFKNMDDSEDTLVNRNFCFVLADISLVALDVVSLRAPRGKHPTDLNVERRLGQVAMRIPASHDVWSCQLRLVYNLVVLVVYRTSSEGVAARLCSEAASNILTTFEAMVAQGTLRLCHPQSSITALMGAAIQFAREVRAAVVKGAIVTAISTQGQLERLLVPADALSPYFANIEAVCRLCKSLNERAGMLIRECQAQNSTSLSTSQLPVKASIDWEDIMTNYRMSNVGSGLEIDDWLNDYNIVEC